MMTTARPPPAPPHHPTSRRGSHCSHLALHPQRQLHKQLAVGGQLLEEGGGHGVQGGQNSKRQRSQVGDANVREGRLHACRQASSGRCHDVNTQTHALFFLTRAEHACPTPNPNPCTACCPHAALCRRTSSSCSSRSGCMAGMRASSSCMAACSTCRCDSALQQRSGAVRRSVTSAESDERRVLGSAVRGKRGRRRLSHALTIAHRAPPHPPPGRPNTAPTHPPTHLVIPSWSISSSSGGQRGSCRAHRPWMSRMADCGSMVVSVDWMYS